MYFIIIKCGLVEKKLYFYFYFLYFFVYLPNHFQKVWTGGQALKIFIFF